MSRTRVGDSGGEWRRESAWRSARIRVSTHACSESLRRGVIVQLRRRSVCGTTGQPMSMSAVAMTAVRTAHPELLEGKWSADASRCFASSSAIAFLIGRGRSVRATEVWRGTRARGHCGAAVGGPSIDDDTSRRRTVVNARFTSASHSSGVVGTTCATPCRRRTWLCGCSGRAERDVRWRAPSARDTTRGHLPFASPGKHGTERRASSI